MGEVQTVDEYLNSLAASQKAELTRIRKIIKETVPSVSESISYGMPTYKYKGKKLIYFAAFKNHLSLFGNLGPLEKKLNGYKLSHKGTLEFTENNPISTHLVEEIIRYRQKLIEKDES